MTSFWPKESLKSLWLRTSPNLSVQGTSASGNLTARPFVPLRIFAEAENARSILKSKGLPERLLHWPAAPETAACTLPKSPSDF